MIKNMRSGMPNLFKKGFKSYKGKNDSTLRSIEACIDLSKMLQTSFGPNGLYKIVINHLERISITSDSASIIKDIEVNHPVAKMVVMAAKMQESEIGDGSNLVIIFAGELCKVAKELIEDGVEINDIVHGYSFALKLVDDILNEIKLDQEENPLQSPDTLEKIIKTAISTKIPGYADQFASIIGLACQPALRKAAETNAAFNVDDVRVCKIEGGSLLESHVLNGLVIESQLEGQAPHADDDSLSVGVIVFNGSVDTQSTETKGVVLMQNAQQLLNFNEGEEIRVESAIKSLSEIGAKLIVTGGSFGEVALHFMRVYGLCGLSVTSKFELQRVVRLTGCTTIPLFGGDVTRENLGFCKRVVTMEIASKKITVLEQDKLDSKLLTVLIRGSTENIRDNAEKAVDDGVNAVKTATKDARVLAGGGASEIELSLRIKAASPGSKQASEQYGIDGFATALEIIPRLLAKSAGLCEHAILSQLIAAHTGGEGASHMGIDVDSGKIEDMQQKKIFDLLLTKQNALRLAGDVVCTLLRIDSIIMSKPAGGPKLGKKHDWDQD